MKKVLRAGIILIACFGLNAAAQDLDAWHHDRDGRFHAEAWRMHLFSQVRQDLDHVQQVTWPRGRDRYRLDRTRHQLDELQGKLEAHRYDERELNEVIGSLSRVVSDNRMAPRDRDVLNDDLNRMRDYREHHDRWFR